MSQVAFSCLTCSALESCDTTSEEKIKTGYHCGDWREEKLPKIVARQQLLRKFADAGASVLIKKLPPTEEE